MMTDEILIKENKLHEELRKLGRVAICFSGGIDSMVLLIECFNVLGRDNVLSITGVSDITIEQDISYVEEILFKYNINHVYIEKDEMDAASFIQNDQDRCYYCKKLFFKKVMEVTTKHGFKNVVDGTNKDDDSDYRPGARALEEFAVISPLKNACIGKTDIYALAQHLGISNYNTGSRSCLATRVPYFEPITYHKIETIAKAEKFLNKKGFLNIRARHHESLLKIEVLEEHFEKIMQRDMRLEIDEYMKSIGFAWTAIDISAYKLGRMNETIIKS